MDDVIFMLYLNFVRNKTNTIELINLNRCCCFFNRYYGNLIISDGLEKEKFMDIISLYGNSL